MLCLSGHGKVLCTCHQSVDKKEKMKLYCFLICVQADGVNVDPLGDLNTATERRLGQLVREKYEMETSVSSYNFDVIRSLDCLDR